MAREPELAELLRRAAAEPADAFDRHDVARRARRVRRNRRLTGAASAVAAVAPMLLVGQLLMPADVSVRFGQGGRLVTIERAAAVSPTPSPTAAPEPGAIASTAPPEPGPGLLGPGPGATASPPSVSPSVSPSPTESSHATVVIKDPPGAPERRPDLPGDRPHPGVMLSLVLERTETAQGERWQGWLEARNTGDEPVDLGEARCWATWGLFRDGTWVGGQADEVCDEPHPRPALPAGGHLRVPLAFDTVAGDERDKGMRQLEPGEYAAAAGLRVEDAAHGFEGVWYAPAVTVTVRAAAPSPSPSPSPSQTPSSNS